MKIPQRKRGGSARRDSYTAVLLLSLIGALVFRIPLGRIIGDKGVAYFGTANEIYLVLAGMIGFGLSEAAAMLIRHRMKREQLRSAQRVISGALLFGGVLGILCSLVLLVSGVKVSETLLHIPLSGMAVSMMAPAIFFYIVTGILRGYCKGNGFKVAVMHSMVLHTLFLFVGGLVGAASLYGYGEKVSALLQNRDYACAYGAMGASLGLLVSSVLCFLHMLVMYFLLKSNRKGQMGRELSRNQDTTPEIFRLLIATGGLYSVFYLVFAGRPLIDQYLLYHLGNGTEDFDVLWGIYYGKYLVLTGVILCLLLLVCLIPVKRIVTLAERDGYRSGKAYLGALIHQSTVLTVPTAVYLAVLSENILDLIFHGNNQQGAKWLQLGSIGLVFAVFAIVFAEILCKLGKQKLVAAISTAALLVHIAVTVLLLSVGKMGVNGLIIGNILFWAVVAAAGFLTLSRRMQYTQEWIRSFAIPLIAAAVSGLLLMLLQKAVMSLAGNVLALLIPLPIAIVGYLVLILALKDFREEELEMMVGGRILITLAKALRLL